MVLRRQQNTQKGEMQGPNHSSAADCTPWELPNSGCRSDHQVLSSCHGLDTPKENCQMLPFLSFHAESSTHLRQRTVVFSLKSTLRKPIPKSPKLTGMPTFTPWGVYRDKTKLQEAPYSCGHTTCLHTSLTLILGWDPRQSQVQSCNTQLQDKLPGRKISHSSCLPPHSCTIFLP